MSIGIITVGNELLTGYIDDTNAAWLGREITALGEQPAWHLTVGDDPQAIVSALTAVPNDVTDVIITGGLGPTHDDITLQTVSDFFGIKLEFDQDYWGELCRRFERRGYPVPEINRNQALVPQATEIIPNPVGSARGALFWQADRRYYILPGVPMEMKAMFTATIAAKIRPPAVTTVIRAVRTTGIMESSLAELLGNLHNDFPAVTLAFLPRLSGLDLRLIGHDPAEVDKFIEKIVERAGKYIYGYDEIKLEEVVGRLLTRHGLTIATAESCTGGLISHRLTQVAGSSNYLLGGIVAYSNDVKIDLLGVRPETLAIHGAVSEETAREMAAGVREKLGADIGLATTGIAGPGGGTVAKPVGLVYIGLAYRERVVVRKMQFIYNRQVNKRLSSQVALNMVRIELENA
ncbi:MAG: competence/damage-inducible protein A [Candidatus Neomarinimicrobiota bacterium]